MSHIRIPELDEFGLNYEEGFRFIHVFLKHYVYHLKEIFSSKSIDDLKAYPLSIADRIVKMSRPEIGLQFIIRQNTIF